MLDKIANGISKMLKEDVTSAMLITYDKTHKTNFTRIDEKK